MPEGARRSEDNRRLLEIQNPRLASEGLWAHATPRPETGGLLIASLDGPTVLNDDRLWQVRVAVARRLLAEGRTATERRHTLPRAGLVLA